jgi:2-polyprenyl-3-methyl-5-hydroxy-6-metoxy-1,4-benzoquinol methylase
VSEPTFGFPVPPVGERARLADIFDYGAEPKVLVGTCNLCGKRKNWDPDREPTKDRYGYNVGVETCRECGLVWLSPRMTAEAYARFYREGFYRRIVSAYHGREINAQTIQPEQLVYAMELADFLGPYIGKAETLLDIGGSTGVVAGYLAERFSLVGTVLDPAVDELKEAHGLRKIAKSVEEWEPGEDKWDVILLCQTVDHLLDIQSTLGKLAGALSDGGILFADIVDYGKTRTIKIDHPFNLTRDTMRAFLAQQHFSAILDEPAPDGVHHRFVCEQ